MGEVYRADDLRLGQPVALKFLPDDVGRDAGRLAQFHNEVRAARQVAHPNICRVYDISEVDGHLFLSMELVDGEDLSSSLRRIGRFAEDKALEIARQLCAGLAAAHERGVLHRDLKPANVMLDGAGKVRLMDFGLAAMGGADGLRAGTPGYMAPEQMQGRDASAESDIYALGLVLYELFTGKRAFTGQTLQALAEQQQSGKLTPPTTIVTALDPAIERAILRCLDPDPSRRPSSPLTVSASLPGGDPLAAALAAGETPSPEMVAASGKGAGLSRGVAAVLLATVIVGAVASSVLALRASVIEHLRPEFSADVLAEKARESLRALGYGDRAQDEAYAFSWSRDLVDHLSKPGSPSIDWTRISARQPSLLGFWYRRSEQPMIGGEFHHDLLTPGLVTPEDPAPIQSGMINARFDHQGRLLGFEAIPPQVEEKPTAPAPVDWTPLLKLAGLDPATLTSATPRWNWLSAPDTRAAWTGTWPGGSDELRVEAAARGGRVTAFVTTGPWTQPWRGAPDTTTGSEVALVGVLFLLALAIIVGGGVLARRNLKNGRGDRQAAFRLAGAMTAALWLLWICQVHFAASIGMIGVFLVAVCTTASYGVLFWAIYLALEPFVRRHWPQTLVSWTTLFSGRVRDPIVGRDVLIGAVIGVATAAVIRTSELLTGRPVLMEIELLNNARATAGVILTQAIYSMRTALLLFYLLFLLRVLLRNQWIAAAALVTLFAGLNMLDAERRVLEAIVTILYFGLFCVSVLRWGLTTFAVGLLVANLVLMAPITTDRSAWYLTSAIVSFALPLALATWAFFASAATGRLKKPGLFDA